MTLPAERRRPTARTSLCALLVAVLGVGALQWRHDEPAAPHDDALRYLALAWGLHEHGTLARSTPGQPAPAPEMIYMPLYPAFVATMLRLDEELRTNVACALEHSSNQAGAGCDPTFTSVLVAQLALLAVALWLIWHLAFAVAGSLPVAWAALAAAIACGWPIEFANSFLLEVPLIALFSALSLGLVRAVQSGRTRWFVLVGATLGTMTLLKAVFAYAALAIGAWWLVLSVLPWLKRPTRPGRRALVAPLVFAVIVAPWVARNTIVFDTPRLSSGYGAHILAERVAYNDMTPTEWAVAFVYWFPDVGDSIANRVFDPKHYERLRRVGERSFYVVGNSSGFRETLEQADARGIEHVSYLLRERVVGNLPKHLAVTIPMAWQGIFISKWWGVLGVGCFVAVLPGMLLRRRTDFVLLATAPLILVALHALLSVSLPRYNLVLLPLLSVCIGISAVGTYRAAARRRRPLR